MIRSIIEDTSVTFFLVFLMALSGRYWLSKGTPEKIIAGVAFGLIAILAMLHPIYLTNEAILDPRLIVITAATFFGGILTGSITTAIAIIYRIYIGGDAVLTAIALMAISVFFSWFASIFSRNAQRITRWIIFCALTAAVQITLTIVIYFVFPPKAEQIKDIVFSQLFVVPIFSVLTFIAVDEAIRKSLREKIIQNSAEKFRGISEAMPDLLMILNEDGKYLDIYTPDESLLASPKSDLIGRSLHEVLPKDKADFFMIWIKSVLNENAVKETEYTLETQGGLKYFEARASAMKATYDGKRAVALLTRDITKYKEAQLMAS